MKAILLLITVLFAACSTAGAEELEARISDFFENHSPEKYLTLRNEIISHPKFNPFGAGLRSLEDCKPQSMLFTLSPVSLETQKKCLEMADKTEEAQKADIKLLVIIDSMLKTGDGTEDKPFKLIYGADQSYAVKELLKLKVVAKEVVAAGEKVYEIYDTSVGKRIWFEVTDRYRAIAARRIDGRNR